MPNEKKQKKQSHAETLKDTNTTQAVSREPCFMLAMHSWGWKTS